MTVSLRAFLRVVGAFFIWSLFGPTLNLSTLTVNQNIWGVSIIGIVLLSWYAARTKQWEKLKDVRLNWAFVLFFITSGVSGILWLTALTLVPIGQATFLWSTIPLITLILAALILHESVTMRKLFALGTGLAGVGLVVSTNAGALRLNQNLLVGLLFIAVAIFLKSLQAVILKRFSVSYAPWVSSALILVSQIVFTTPFVLFSPWQMNLPSIAALVALGVVSTLAFFLFVSSFSVLSSSTVMMAGFIEPFLASLWGFLLLGQAFTLAVFAGGFLILVSGYIVTRSEGKLK